MLLQRSNSGWAGVSLTVTANFVFNFQGSSKGILESGKIPSIYKDDLGGIFYTLFLMFF